ncbi:MAG: hypothetical protein V4726_17580 [Verrucomicrobiota bacterium]
MIAAPLLLFPAPGAHAQVWTPAHGPVSPATNILSFDNGADSSATSPLPGAPSFPGTGITSSSIPATSVGGGWDLSASGSTAVYVSAIPVASMRSNIVTASGELQFNTLNGGVLSGGATLTPNNSWRASAVITGSNSWTSVGNEFRYDFQIDLSSALLALNPGISPNFGLLIEDGAGTDLYHATDLGALLGVMDLSAVSYGRTVGFNYDPSTGPLKITWSGSQLASVSTLGAPIENLLTVRTSQVKIQSLPEASSLWLAGLALSPVLLRRRRA